MEVIVRVVLGEYRTRAARYIVQSRNTSSMALLAFAEGLVLAYEAFHVSKIETRIKKLEEDFHVASQKLQDISTEVSKCKLVIERFTNYEKKVLMEHAFKMLARFNAANVANAEVVALLAMSLGGTLSAITFKGKKKKVLRGALPFYKGFVSGVQSPEKIIETFGKLGELASISDGKIVTACVSSEEEMKTAALSVALFYKYCQIIRLRMCPLSDDSSTKQTLTIKFEGRYSLGSYQDVWSDRERKISFVRSARKNIYILGVNGVGKSSWGNLITGERVFEVGMSNHTTMIPESYDITQNGLDYRLWDTPGLFDGSEQQAAMEAHMNSVIELNNYCSGVLFVFHGATAANEQTYQTLEYAKHLLGDHVQKQFLAIVNDWGGMGELRKGSFVEMLYETGYEVGDDNVIVASAVDDQNAAKLIVRKKLATFSPVLVRRYKEKYDRIVNSHGGELHRAVRAAHISSKNELTALLRRGKIETVRYKGEPPNKNISVPKNLIIFRQHSKGYFFRKFGLQSSRVLEEKKILLKGSQRFQITVRAQLNMEYQLSQVGVFLNSVLAHERHILIHTPREDHDYELWDASAMEDEDLRIEVERIILHGL